MVNLGGWAGLGWVGGQITFCSRNYSEETRGRWESGTEATSSFTRVLTIFRIYFDRVEKAYIKLLNIQLVTSEMYLLMNINLVCHCVIALFCSNKINLRRMKMASSHRTK